MSRTLFVTIRYSCLIISVFVLIDKFNSYSDIKRDLVFLFSVLLFLVVSGLYERRIGVISPGYIFYCVVLFIDLNLCPYTLYYNEIASLNEALPYIKDHYYLYNECFVASSIVIIIYLLSIRIRSCAFKTPLMHFVSKNKIMIYTLMICLFLSKFLGQMGILLAIYPISYFILKFLLKIRKGIFFKIGLLLSILVVLSTITMRYIFIEFTFPIIFMFILLKSFKGDKKFSWKILLGGFGLISLIGIYGIVSELIKLSMYYEGHYTISDGLNILSNYEMLWEWIHRQTYRIFDIWTKLGNNIIEYTDEHGFFYGLTYIKQLSIFFEIPYVNLPEISANLIGASYAQPGLLAEGYANFGVIGAICNMICPFFIAEYFLLKYKRTRSLFYFIVLCSCFTQVLLDGGTVMSILVLFFYCLIAKGIYDLLNIIICKKYIL